ncbi:MAG: hypothetical protein ACI9TH_003138 [Kiritimatiellia bacterium]|jgi:hypothetical protein
MKTLIIALLCLTAGSPYYLSAQDAASPPRPKVLIIGDSISNAYTPHLTQLLKEVALVKHHAGNAGPTIRGMEEIEKWLGDTKWDLIHFNWGLWDMYGWAYMKQDRSPAAYEQRLDTLVQRLKKTDAKLIWGTTTPICPEVEVQYRKFGGEGEIDQAIEAEYLVAAARVMKKYAIEVNDLHALMLPDLQQYALAPNNVHFNKAGNELLAKQIAERIATRLNLKP